MFNLSGSELVFILLLALVVLGPEKLPDAMRKFGRAVSEMRRMTAGFQEEFRSGLDEPMREMRETADLIRGNADFGSLARGFVDPKAKSPSAMSVDLTPEELAAPVHPDPEPDDDVDAWTDEDVADDAVSAVEATDGVEQAPTDAFGAVPSPAPSPEPVDGLDHTADDLDDLDDLDDVDEFGTVTRPAENPESTTT